MISRLLLCEGTGFDPCENLAREELLLSRAQDCCILYLWQNENTVVIGRNQNPWKECRCALLEQEGGRLARRLSGGGAVFHDRGNLNFTFLLPEEDFDKGRQTEVLLRALRGLEIPAERSGRNDLLAGGRKFSGHAYYHHEGRAYHHGTLLVEADLEKLGRYLAPSPAKLRAKGVDSVRARVCNLRELAPTLTIPALKAALTAAFGEVYGLPVEPLEPETLAGSALTALTARYGSWDWNFGQRQPFDLACEGRFAWGEARLELRVEAGLIQSARVYTDAMDWTLSPRAEVALTGCRLEKTALRARLLAALPETGEALSRLLEENL
ncbi:MAG: lipoate--protein ligase [Oscillospiraceae bacterium]|nr:lipoate--protein ligase [Oscillospiraceae bacterium]